MGEPDMEYKAKVQSLILAEKQAKADAEKKKKAAEAERARLLQERKKKVEEARKAREAAAQKKGEKDDKGKDEEGKEKEEEEEKSAVDATMEEDPPVELSAEEKQICHRKADMPDVSEQALSRSFANFTLPAMDEGYTDVSYEWQDEAACRSLLTDWIRQMKLTYRVEELQPGAWFKEEWASWQKLSVEWRKRQNEWKNPAGKKAMIAKKKADLKSEVDKQSEDKMEDAEEKKGAKDDKEGKDEKDGKEPELPEINVEDLDVFAVDDVNDLGNCEPLYANFGFEDWALLSVRYEFHLLLHAFKKDLNDPDRPSFGEAHLHFYYNKYFKKPFNLKSFGVEKLAEFVEILRDALSINEKSSLIEPLLPDSTTHAHFVKLTEEHRRDRQRRIDAGDETAALKLSKPPSPPPKPAAPQQQSRYGGGSGGRPWQAPQSSEKRSWPQANTYANKQQRTSYSTSYGSSGGSYRR